MWTFVHTQTWRHVHTESCLCANKSTEQHTVTGAQAQAHHTKSSGATPPVLPRLAPHCPLLAAWWPGQPGTTSVSAALGWLSASSLLDQEARSCLRCSPKPALAPGECLVRGLKLEDKNISPSHPKESLPGRMLGTMVAGILQRHPPAAAGRHPRPYLGDCAHTCSCPAYVFKEEKISWLRSQRPGFLALTLRLPLGLSSLLFSEELNRIMYSAQHQPPTTTPVSCCLGN